MKRHESGISLLELVVVVALSATLTLIGTVFTFHAIRSSRATDSRLVTLTNVQNAGRWISQDAYMADDIDTDNLTFPAILLLRWTEWGYGVPNKYYSATYSVDNITDNVGQINRRYQGSDGTDQTITLARNIYYNEADPENSTNVSYQTQVLSLQLAARQGAHNEVRKYQIFRRPNF